VAESGRAEGVEALLRACREPALSFMVTRFLADSANKIDVCDAATDRNKNIAAQQTGGSPVAIALACFRFLLLTLESASWSFVVSFVLSSSSCSRTVFFTRAPM